MPMPRQMLEESKGPLEDPAVFMDQGDDFRRYLQRVRGDGNPLTLFRAALSGLAARLAVGSAFHLDDAHL